MDDGVLLFFLQNSTKSELEELLKLIDKQKQMYEALKEKIIIEFS